MKIKRNGKQGKHIRIYCRECRKKITINYKEERDEQLLKKHLNRGSYRILENEERISRKTICSLTTRVTGELIHSNELIKIMQSQNYRGIIMIDGKYVPVRDTERAKSGLVPRSAKRRGKTKGGLVILSFIDYFTHGIPIHIVSLSENMYEIEEGFRMLKEIGYPLKTVV